MVDDIERRADQAAVRLTGRPEPLARAIAGLFQASQPLPGEGDASFERVFWRIRREGVERRCARLLSADDSNAGRHGRLQFALAAAAVLGLVFFIV